MGNLTNKFVKNTYDGLIKLTDETQGVKATLQPLQDGLGNDLPIQVSSTEVVITGSFYGDGTNLTGITTTSASYSDYAVTASYAEDFDTSSLVVDVDLVTPFQDVILVTKGDGSANQFVVNNVQSASFATSASYALNAGQDTFVTGATFNTSTGNIALQRNEGEPDVTVNIDGRYVTLTQGQSESLRLDFIEAATASLNAYTASQGDIRDDFNSFTSSQSGVDSAQDGRLDSLETESGSMRGDFNSFTSSQSGVDSAQDGRLDSIESKTGSYATTGSNTFVGQQQINSDLIVQGNLYVSGSETIISSSTLIVGDREIELNANRTVGNAGIIVYDVISPETTGSLQYDATNNYWIIGQYGSEERVIDSSMTSSMSVLSSSYSNNSTSASYAENATSASYADVAGSAGATDSALRTTITAKNVSGSPIAKGTPCYVTGSGTSGNVVGVFPADAGNPSRMPAGVVLNEALNDGDEGEAIVIGFINGVDTSAFGSGDNIYVAVGGGYTNVKPTGSALIQKLGNVEKADLNGSGVITGPGRANDVPNIQEGYIWVGNSDQVATPTSTGSFARRDEVNTFTENQTINGSLTINAQDSSPFTISSGSSNITVQMGEFGGATQPEIIFTGDNSFFAATNNFVVSADSNMDVRSNGGNATLQSNNNTANVLAGDRINLSGSNQLNINTSNVTITDSDTTIQGTTTLNGAATVNGLTTVNGQISVISPEINALQISSGSGTGGSINFNLQNFGASQPTLYFSGDNSYFQADGNFSVENAPGGQGTGSMNFTTNGYFGIATNGTGSENIAISTATGNFNFNVAGGANTFDVNSSNFKSNGSYIKNDTNIFHNKSTFFNSGSIYNGVGTSTTSTLTMGPTSAGRFKRNELINFQMNFDEQSLGKHVTAWYDYSNDYWDSEFGVSTSTGLDGSNRVFYLQAGRDNGSSGNTVWWTGEDGYWHILKDMKIENSVEITGSLTAGGGSTLSGTNTINGPLQTYNSVTLHNGASMTGSVYSNGPIYADGGITNTSGVLNIGSDNQINMLNFLTISSGSVVNGLLEIKDGVNITGSTILSSGSTLNVLGSANFTGSLVADGGISTSTGNLNLGGASGVSILGELYVQNANLYAKDIIMDDPGAISSLVQNPNVFSEYKGNALRWQENTKKANLIMYENEVYISMNGYDPAAGYTYDQQFDIKTASGSLEFSTYDYTVDFNPQTFLKVVGKSKPQLTNGVHITGSVAQQPHNITISSATASIDFSQSNIQTLTLAGGVATHIETTNMVAGQSVLVEITQDGSSAGTVTIDGSITFAGGTEYVPTTTLGGKDVLTLVSFDGSVSRAAGQNDFS